MTGCSRNSPVCRHILLDAVSRTYGNLSLSFSLQPHCPQRACTELQQGNVCFFFTFHNGCSPVECRTYVLLRFFRFYGFWTEYILTAPLSHCVVGCGTGLVPMEILTHWSRLKGQLHCNVKHTSGISGITAFVKDGSGLIQLEKRLLKCYLCFWELGAEENILSCEG